MPLSPSDGSKNVLQSSPTKAAAFGFATQCTSVWSKSRTSDSFLELRRRARSSLAWVAAYVFVTWMVSPPATVRLWLLDFRGLGFLGDPVGVWSGEDGRDDPGEEGAEEETGTLAPQRAHRPPTLIGWRQGGQRGDDMRVSGGRRRARGRGVDLKGF